MSSIAAITTPDPAAPTAEDVRNSTNALKSTGGSATLGQDDFFSLITAQMVNQNPLEPMKDTDFIAQMASFSSLEQMSQLNEGFADYRRESMGIAAAAYLDKTVTVSTDRGDLSGRVTQVNTSSQGTSVVIDGETYNVNQITSVNGDTSGAPHNPPTGG